MRQALGNLLDRLKAAIQSGNITLAGQLLGEAHKQTDKVEDNDKHGQLLSMLNTILPGVAPPTGDWTTLLLKNWTVQHKAADPDILFVTPGGTPPPLKWPLTARAPFFGVQKVLVVEVYDYHDGPIPFSIDKVHLSLGYGKIIVAELDNKMDWYYAQVVRQNDVQMTRGGAIAAKWHYATFPLLDREETPFSTIKFQDTALVPGHIGVFMDTPGNAFGTDHNALKIGDIVDNKYELRFLLFGGPKGTQAGQGEVKVAVDWWGNIKNTINGNCLKTTATVKGDAVIRTKEGGLGPDDTQAYLLQAKTNGPALSTPLKPY